MSLFDILKPKKKQPIKHNSNAIEDDFNPFDTNSTIAYIKRKKPDATEEDILQIINDFVAPAKDLDHLTPDGELPWGWFNANRNFTEKHDEEYRVFSNKYHECIYGRPKERLETLKNYVHYMEYLKEICKTKGECFVYWRECHFLDDFFEKKTKELTYLEENLEELEEQYIHDLYIKEVFLPNLRKQLIETIKTNPGILQKNVYKLYDTNDRNCIQQELYYMARDNEIIRQKVGNSYSLTLP